jgi:hypothetical protein
MNWGELKLAIRDLGFEEDATMTEYTTIVRNAANRAINMLIQDVLVPNKNYFEATLSYWTTVTDPDTGEETRVRVKWELPDMDQITADTADTTEIDLPDRVIPILSRLASHYVWLDDDQVKATIYWNEYDDFKATLFDEARSRNYNCEFYGGLWF